MHQIPLILLCVNIKKYMGSLHVLLGVFVITDAYNSKILLQRGRRGKCLALSLYKQLLVPFHVQLALSLVGI